MSKYDLQQVIKMWAQEKLTAEQVIGQMLLHLEELLQRVRVLESQSAPGRSSPGTTPAEG